MSSITMIHVEKTRLISLEEIFRTLLVDLVGYLIRKQTIKNGRIVITTSDKPEIAMAEVLNTLKHKELEVLYKLNNLRWSLELTVLVNLTT